MLKLVTAKKLRGFLAFLFFLIPILAHAQKPGSFYWGDSDMDGIISGNDYATVVSVYMDNTQNDADLYFGYPQSRYRQDLDGDGLISGADISFLESWFVGDWNTYGAPATLEWEGASVGLTIDPADTVGIEISAVSYSSAGAGHWPRTGFGIIFAIDPTSQCASTAQIYGFDPAGGATVWDWRNPVAYDYQPTLVDPELGIAAVKVRAVGCALGSIIRLTAYIPGDMEYLIPGQRFPARLTVSPTPIGITVGSPAPTCETVAIDPASATIPELGSAQFRAVCSMSDSTTTDCTAATTFGVTGDLFLGPKTATQQVYALHVPGEAGGSGTVIGNNTDCATPVATPASVTVTNDETLAALSLTPTDATIPELGSVQMTTTGILTDGSTTNCTVSCNSNTTTYSSYEKVTVNATGLVTGLHTPKCTNLTGRVNAANSGFDSDEVVVRVTNDEQVVGLEVLPATDTVFVGSTIQLRAVANISDGTTYSCRLYCCQTDTLWSDTSSFITVPYAGVDGLVYGDTSGMGHARATNNGYTDYSVINVVSPYLPDTTITSTPPNLSNLAFVQFGFTCSEIPATYECQLDGGTWSPCLNPKDYPDFWTETSTANAPLGRRSHSAVWTGSLMVVWGGYNGSYLNSGGRYDPATDSWTATSLSNVPEARRYHTAVWTESSMTIWGGYNGNYLNSGGRYDPATDTWAATSLTNVPQARSYHTAVWTGSAMIVWGGEGSGISYLNTGGRYDPATDTWTATSLINAPAARRDHTAVWTGSEMIVWGGFSYTAPTCQSLKTGGRYDPAGNSWTATPLANAPERRRNHTAVWTGSEMIVWGGEYYPTCYDYYPLNTGGRYDPAANSWTATSLTNAPTARVGHSAVWTGSSMIIWGGGESSIRWSECFNTGGRYDLATNKWTATPLTNAPSLRQYHTAVWIGEKMIVWGGYYSTTAPFEREDYLATGGILEILDERSYNFAVRCTDEFGYTDPTPATYTWTIDHTPPDTQITLTPPSLAFQDSATFEFTSNDPGSSFECKLDIGFWTACPSPQHYSGLADGSHIFQVRAIDPAGNPDPIPASYSWTSSSCSSLAISPASATIPELGSAQFRAVCVMLDSSTTDCTSATTFGVTGSLALGMKTATQQVDAFHVPGEDGGAGTVAGTNALCATPVATPASVTVTNDETLAAIAITPDSATIPELGSVQLTATGTLSDASTINCTTSCMGAPTIWWDTGVIMVLNGLVTAGHISGCIGGSGLVIAVNSGYSSNISAVTLTNDEYVAGITLAPESAMIVAGDTDQFNATCTISDATSEPCNNSSACGTVTTWDNDHPEIANVSSSGLVTGLSPSPPVATITATNNSQSDYSIITVGVEPSCAVIELTAISGSNSSYPTSKDASDTTGSALVDIQSDNGFYYTVGEGLRMYMDSFDVSGIPADAVIDGVTIEANYYTSAQFTSAYIRHSTNEGGAWTNDVQLTQSDTELTLSAAIADVTTRDQIANLDVDYTTVSGSGQRNTYFDYWLLKVRYHTFAIIGPLTDITELESKSYSALLTNFDGSTADYTAASTIAGDCSGGSGIITGNHVPGGDEPAGTCQVMCDTVSAGDITLHNDDTPPETIITSTPPNPSNLPEATFEFTCNKPPCTYECQLDSEAWESCSSPKTYLGSEIWSPTSLVSAPAARYFHTAIWTGSEMIVWAGYNGTYLNTGGRYNPVTDSWTPTSVGANVPSGRYLHTAVWTGNEMIVWGGSLTTNTGGRYNPSTDSWTATSTTSAPQATRYHTAVWTGNRMIVWGGRNASNNAINTGGQYNPSDDSWTTTSLGANVPQARWWPGSVWTETEMIIWGGYGASSTLNTGSKYNPLTDTWTVVTTTNAPAARDKQANVWTGSEMLVWGGDAGGSVRLNTGGRYNPVTDSWSIITTAGAPSPRWQPAAVWTGSEMIIWGGDCSPLENTGGKYNPSLDAWVPTSTINAPSGRINLGAVWTGSAMIVWGGNNSGYLADGGVYGIGGEFGEGDHTFSVRAYDALLNVDPTPASYDWTMDLTPPGTFITLSPDNPTYSADADFEFACNESDCTFECKLDSGPWAACTSPQHYSGLSQADHTFQARATDAAGNLDTTPASYTWEVEPIDTFITSMPPDPSSDPEADFEFGCDQPECTFECSLDYAEWSVCISPQHYSGLWRALHNFQVRAYDEAFNVDPTPASYNWFVDPVPPDTFIDTHPPDPTELDTAQFSFSCDKVIGCSYECDLDSSGWLPCESPATYGPLLAGQHYFQVRAISSGLTDPTPATFSWTIIADTIITSQPANPSNQTGAAFSFICSYPPCTFECRIDGGEFAPCDSPKEYSGLSESSHTFEVRAIDGSFNVDPTPASYTWTIDLTPPETTITSSPPDPSGNNFAIFTFSCSEAGCTFQCNLDSGGWLVCPSPVEYTSLANGAHNFQVRAIDLATNPDLSPAVYNWTINATPPDTIITSNPPDPSNSQHASFEFTCSELPCTYQCKLDSEIWKSCSSPKIYEGEIEMWTATSLTNAPSARADHNAVWTGTEMIVWGGSTTSGGRYNPVTDSWTPTSPVSFAPREGISAVWTGNVMMIWGGCLFGFHPACTTAGRRYNPATNSWDGVSTTNAPVGRAYSAMVWTGEKVIVWGGYHYWAQSPYGGQYDPVSNTWTPVPSASGVPATLVSAVWTGSEMIVWGGFNGNYLNTGGRYNPVSNSWTLTSTTNAPPARHIPSAVWTGDEMLVWGGCPDLSIYWSFNYYCNSDTNTGGRYNPLTDSWMPISIGANAPEARFDHTAVWTGNEMIVWGGHNVGSGANFNNGGRYNPVTDSWTATSLTNAPEARAVHTAVWTGNEMIVWGGASGTGAVNTGGKYNPGYLPEGDHTFSVRAYDVDLNVDPTPAVYDWTVDLTAPVTSITSGPLDPTTLQDAQFQFICNEVSCTFECNLDSGGWEACVSPKEYLGLTIGIHGFEVRATDAAGNTEQVPASYTWTIEP